MTTEKLNEDFTGGEINDDDEIAMQIYLTPDQNIKIETGVASDEDGNPLPEQEAMENTLMLLRTALFTLSEEYIRLYGAELSAKSLPSNKQN